MTGVIYARFSSDRQNETSIDAQDRACREYAEKNSIRIVDTYVDEAISGKTANRARYQAMLRAAKLHKFDVILIHKYDRIARNLGEHVNLEARLREWNVKLIAVAQDFGDGKEAKLTKGIQWLLSEYYLDNLSEETKKGHKETALKALHNGGCAPFGYSVIDQKYVINEKEAHYVRLMFDACIHKRGYADIVDELAAIGMTGHRGKPIRYPQIYEILRNEKYTGTYLYSMTEDEKRTDRREKKNAIRIEDAFPAIVSREVFEQAQRIMETRRRHNTAKHRLSGMVYCKCGAKMHIYTTSATYPDGSPKTVFRCSKHCGAGPVSVRLVDGAVDGFVKRFLTDDVRRELNEGMTSWQAEKAERERDFERQKAKDIKAKEAELQKLLQFITAGTLDAETSTWINEQMSEKIKQLDALKALRPTEMPPVEDWVSAVLESDPDSFVHQLISKIVAVQEDKKHLNISMYTTLMDIVKHPSETEGVSENGCGGYEAISLLRYFPAWYLSETLRLIE